MNIQKRLHPVCLLLLATFLFALPLSASNHAAEEDEKLDVKEVVLGHMSDTYDWHITTWNGHHVSIPLPIIEGRNERMARIQFCASGTR